MISIFTKNKQMQGQYEQLQAEHNNLLKEVEELRNKLAAIPNADQLAEVTAKFAAVESERNTLVTKVQELTDSLAKLSSEKQDFDKEVATKVATIVAQQGIPQQIPVEPMKLEDSNVITLPNGFKMYRR